ncbi:uncharacterized protein BCR38DRAFT_413081 [Pseudomassariella vexata]|uniref:Uncharacterized protein n=1 Tax=Pseudomassariella vexata TaxID=1141098 RepID=A0A1Y2DHN7_9PEZI|nr:uncharacterized protein BCR38DRAFT_413081 [Pseudomassariella vexata]ORY58762.1 hypothetical protein BCR38DRAFT_413081 [Pseudomassariella vexata]
MSVALNLVTSGQNDESGRVAPKTWIECGFCTLIFLGRTGVRISVLRIKQLHWNDILMSFAWAVSDETNHAESQGVQGQQAIDGCRWYHYHLGLLFPSAGVFIIIAAILRVIFVFINPNPVTLAIGLAARLSSPFDVESSSAERIYRPDHSSIHVLRVYSVDRNGVNNPSNDAAKQGWLSITIV